VDEPPHPDQATVKMRFVRMVTATPARRKAAKSRFRGNPGGGGRRAAGGV